MRLYKILLKLNYGIEIGAKLAYVLEDTAKAKYGEYFRAI